MWRGVHSCRLGSRRRMKQCDVANSRCCAPEDSCVDLWTRNRHGRNNLLRPNFVRKRRKREREGCSMLDDGTRSGLDLKTMGDHFIGSDNAILDSPSDMSILRDLPIWIDAGRGRCPKPEENP